MSARSTLFFVGLVAWPLAATAAVGDQPRIYGGQAAEACEFPSVVTMAGPGSLCTGTLVHPELVLFAAHCEPPTVVAFGELSTQPARVVPVDHCDRFIDMIEVGPDDYAYCKLSEPVLDVPITPVVYGCETSLLQAGEPAWIAGFGETETNVVGRKHWAQTEIIGLTQMILVGDDGVSAWQGDSGGPAFLRLSSDDSWHAFGITSGGVQPGMPIQYVPMHTVVPWVEMMSGVDITPCHDVNGIWQPSDTCGHFATDPLAGGDWAEGCDILDPQSGPSATCGAPYLVDDDLPAVEITAPVDGAEFADDPSSIDFLIDASDADTGIRRVWLELDGEEFGEDTLAPFEFNGVVLAAGGYLVLAGAEDKAGNVAYSAPVAIGVGGEEPPSSETGDGETGASGAEGAAGCGCSTGRGGWWPSFALLSLFWWGRRRRTV